MVIEYYNLNVKYNSSTYFIKQAGAVKTNIHHAPRGLVQILGTALAR